MRDAEEDGDRLDHAADHVFRHRCHRLHHRSRENQSLERPRFGECSRKPLGALGAPRAVGAAGGAGRLSSEQPLVDGPVDVFHVGPAEVGLPVKFPTFGLTR